MFEADRHNFGKCVKRIERASDHWYQKPRSVFWEHLFFGRSSPIKNIFDIIGSNGNRPLSDYLFNLDVKIENIWNGYSKEIISESNPILNEHFYSFGVLIGYCYLLGIRDLHKYNLAIKSNSLQVIDAEVVLTNLILPNETILLPFREIPFELSAISLICEDLKSLTSSQIKNIFAGYFDVSSIILENFAALNNTLSHELVSAELEHPIRVILKNTKQYRDFLMGIGSTSDFLPEELAQLERGDIPYFFKRLGDKNLYFLLDSTHQQKSVKNLPLELQRDMDRHARTPETLLPKEISIIKKVATGGLYLQKILRPITALELNAACTIKLDQSVLIFKNQKFTINPSTVYDEIC